MSRYNNQESEVQMSMYAFNKMRDLVNAIEESAYSHNDGPNFENYTITVKEMLDVYSAFIQSLNEEVMAKFRAEEQKLKPEISFRKKVIRWLENNGCVVVENDGSRSRGVPTLTWFCNNDYGFIECSMSERSLSSRQLSFSGKIGHPTFIVWPGDRWEKVKEELDYIISRARIDN